MDDINTDLPQLPERYFWRVRWVSNIMSATAGWYELQVRRRHLIGSTLYAQKTICHRPNELNADVIYNAARALMQVYLDEQERRAARGSTASLLGDYPPKKLGS